MSEGEDYRKPYAPEDFAHPSATDIQIVLGEQPDGSWLTLIDLDTHHEGQNAHEARATLERDRPELARRLPCHASRSGKGLHSLVKSFKQITAGKLFDATGKHIGEIVTTRTLDPGDVPIGVLNQSQVESLLNYWSVEGGALGGEQWRARSAEGKRYAGAWPRYRVTKAELRTFLLTHCGQPGAHLNALFDSRKAFNRSDAAGSLMQCLMFNVHKVAPAAGYTERCARAMALWMAADSYGKASDKDYNQELDGFATIAKILVEAPKLNGGRWRAPFWAKSHPTPPRDTPASAAETVPHRPAHRPAGDRERMLAKIRRYFELRAFECDGRIIYHVDDLAERFDISRRTMQTYLHDLEHTHKLITRGQEPGPGGRAWLIWGADNSENRPKNDTDDAPIWGADASAMERLPMQETADRSPVCKVDHQDLSAPAPAALGGPAGPQPFGDLRSAPAGARTPPADLELASYDPRRDCIEGSGIWSDAWCDPTVPRLRPDAPIPASEPRKRRQRREKGQQSFMGRDGAQIGAKYQRRKTVAEMPAPAPHRTRSCMPEALLPEPPPRQTPEPLPQAELSGVQLRESLLARLYARKAAQGVAQ